MRKRFRELLNEELTNPEFKMEWDNLEDEFQIHFKLDPTIIFVAKFL